MKNEQLFKLDGVYYAIVTHNILMHDEATDKGTKLFKRFFELRRDNTPIRVLDLACGGTPVSISDMMENVENATFSYTGIDIHPDQIACACDLFQFSDNVTEINFFEGNAWDLSGLVLEGPFDIIFSGLNFHHGTPEELDYLIIQLKALLDDKGVLINHDWYRPDDETYTRRPSQNPNDKTESYRLVPREKLNQAVAPYANETIPFDGTHARWRLSFIDGLTESYREKTKDDQGADTLKSHMLERDFPASRKDFSQILTRNGFYHKILGYPDPGLQIWPFMAMPVACKDEQTFLNLIEAVSD